VIDVAERAKMLLVPLCGQRVVARLEAIGVRRLSDLRGEDPFDLMERVNLAAGDPIWRPPMATRALENLIAAAEDEANGG
jgi:hypothetical protein